jgi:hypothetical protein
MKRGFLWIVGGMVIAAVAVGAFVLLTGPGGPLAATISAQTPAQAPTVTIRAADSPWWDRSARRAALRRWRSNTSCWRSMAPCRRSERGGGRCRGGRCDPLLRLDTSDLELSDPAGGTGCRHRAEFARRNFSEPASVIRAGGSARRSGHRRSSSWKTHANRRRRLNSPRRAPASPRPGPRTTISRQAPSAAELVKLEANLRKTEDRHAGGAA